MNDAVRISVLGPMEVHGPSGPTPVAGIRLQSVLAMLALAAPHPVSTDRLLEGVWGDDQPAKPANALQALISHLRRLTGGDIVARRGAGYVLTCEPDEIDVARLEDLVQRGRSKSAAGDYREAADCFAAGVELHRGTPLGQLADLPFARAATPRLEDLIVTAHEGWAECGLATGRHEEVVDALTALVAEHPDREQLRAQLMTALYRCGRQRDALAVYDDARRHLRDEYGLDPGPALQALERAVLAHDPALAAPIALTPQIALGGPLPAPLTSFVGRSDELVELAATIESGRLTSVVGPAGVGKTRLVLELGADLGRSRPLVLVELAPVAEAGAVPEAIATAVGAFAAKAGGGSTVDPVVRAVERIADREVVVILDNCEHLTAPVADVAGSLLSGCPNLRIVATSRQPLGLEGELQFSLGPLDERAAALLFADRARAVHARFDSTGRAEDVAAVCHQLDGLPLAIELAAARTKTLTLAEISARLRNRFTLLRRVGRPGDSRHEGLQAAIDWSYDLLFEEERRVFRWMAVFAGGATVPAIEAVCGGDVLQTVGRLVDRSLLVADTSADEVRFSMLESLRDYASDRLADEGEDDEARKAHLTWCLELAAQAEIEARRADQLVWLARLDREHDNMRAALTYAVRADPQLALRLACSLFLPWWFRGRRQEMRQWNADCLAAVADTPSIERARALAFQGFIAEPDPGSAHPTPMEVALAAAERQQREAVRMCHDLGLHRAGVLLQLFLMSTMTRRAAAGSPLDAEEFRRLADETARESEATGDPYVAGSVAVTIAVGAMVTGDLDAVRDATERARQHAEASGERYLASRVHYLLGMQADLAGDHPRAYRHIERSLRLLDELGISEEVNAQARLLVPLAEECGQPELAMQWRAFVSSRTTSWSFFDGTVFAAAHNLAGLRARHRGELDRARDAHRAALDWYARAGLHAGAAFSASCLGFLATERGVPGEAERDHYDALAAAERSNDPAAMALALEGIASVTPRADAAARLLGTAATVRARAASSSPPTHRDDVARLRERLRSVLGGEAFDDATAAGTGSELDDVVADVRAVRLR